MVETLVHNVHSHHFIPGSDQPNRSWPRRSFADFDAVHRRDWHERWAGAGEKSLFGVIEVIGRKIPFDNLNAQVLASSKITALVIPPSTFLSVGVQSLPSTTKYERSSSQVAGDVQHQWDRPRIHLFCLERRDLVIHLVGDLRLRLQTLWRNPARRHRNSRTRKN